MTGKPVWLRFAADMNWYQSDEGEHKYKGKAEDFQKAWNVMSDALEGVENVFVRIDGAAPSLECRLTRTFPAAS